MRLVSFNAGGQSTIGLRLSENFILDLPRAAELLGRERLPEDMVSFLQGGDAYLDEARWIAGVVESDAGAARALYRSDTVQLLAPVPRPGKIICVGRNYTEHAAEHDEKVPAEPLIFAKFANAVIGPEQPIVLPAISKKVDYEAELALVIGRRGRRIPVEEAYNYIAGYMAFNDISARDLQFKDGQWVRAKSCDTFAPTGPWLVTRDEIPDPHGLAIELKLNGSTMQSDNTGNMVFKVDQLVSFVSQGITLEPGDIISTGTPAGVGAFRKEPVFLAPGDVVEVITENIGTLRNYVTSE